MLLLIFLVQHFRGGKESFLSEHILEAIQGVAGKRRNLSNPSLTID
jgi:hypothetical protein